MSKKFNYEAVTVDKVNKYVSNMIKNPDAYRVMELLSDAKAVQNSPLMKEEDMDTLAMAMDELIVTPTPKEDMAVCKIINHILHKDNLELPNDDSECIEMMIQMIGDTIAENKLGNTTEIAYTAFSDVLQGLCHQDVMSGIDDQDVLETCAFIYFINAAASCTMENMYQEIAASAPKTDAKDEGTKEEKVTEKKEKSSKTEKDTNNDITEEDKKAIEKIKGLTAKYFEDVADAAGFEGDARKEFISNMMTNVDDGFASKIKDAPKTKKETSKPPVVVEQPKTKVPDRPNPDQVVTNIADEMFSFIESKIANMTGCMKDIDNGFLYNAIKESIQEKIDKMNPAEVTGDEVFYSQFTFKYFDEISEYSIKKTLNHTVDEVAKSIDASNLSDTTSKLQVLNGAIKGMPVVSNIDNTCKKFGNDNISMFNAVCDSVKKQGNVNDAKGFGSVLRGLYPF